MPDKHPLIHLLRIYIQTAQRKLGMHQTWIKDWTELTSVYLSASQGRQDSRLGGRIRFSDTRLRSICGARGWQR